MARTICAAECRIVAAGLGAQLGRRRDDVGGLAGVNDADVAGAAPAVLFDLAEPAIAVQSGDGQRGDGDGVDSLFGNHARMAGPAA